MDNSEILYLARHLNIENKAQNELYGQHEWETKLINFARLVEEKLSKGSPEINEKFSDMIALANIKEGDCYLDLNSYDYHKEFTNESDDVAYIQIEQNYTIPSVKNNDIDVQLYGDDSSYMGGWKVTLAELTLENGYFKMLPGETPRQAFERYRKLI